MFINEKNLYRIDDNNINVFVIENNVKDVINKTFFIASIFYNVTNCF